MGAGKSGGNIQGESEPLLAGSLRSETAASTPSGRKPGLVDKLVKQVMSVNVAMLGLMVLVILTGTTNRIMFKIMLNHWPAHYLYFISQVTTFVYVPIFFCIVGGEMAFTERITMAMRNFPKWKFAVMGTFDATAGVFMVFGGAQTSGPMQQLLLQSSIPLTMGLTLLVSTIPIFRSALNVRYRWVHYLGATVIIGGIMVALSGQLFAHKKKAPASAGGGHKEGEPYCDGQEGGGSVNNTVVGIILFLMAMLPQAMSSVYKEIAFKGAVDLEVNFVNAWVALFQAAVGIPLAVFTFIPNVPGGVQPKEIGNSVWNGVQCLFANEPAGADGGDACCSSAWPYVLGYMAANIFYNIILLAMLKYGSATLYFICSAVILPMANISFTFKWLMGSSATPLSIYDIFGLVGVLLGLILYRFMPEGQGKPKPGEQGYHDDDEEIVPILFLGGIGEPMVFRKPPEHMPRTASQIRTGYLSRLGFEARSPSPGFYGSTGGK